MAPDRDLFCQCVRKFPENTDLERSSVWYLWPHWVQNNILLCGRKKSMFPCHLLVGPDWPVMIGTYLEIIVPTVFFIAFVCENISRIMTYVAIFFLLFVLGSFSYTACSDPGMILLHEYEVDPESPPSNQAIQCSQCQVVRPNTARHCYHCGVCVDKLDHHCCFTGKCIGKKNIYSFYAFVGSLYIHCLYVFGITAYFIIFVLIVPAISKAVK